MSRKAGAVRVTREAYVARARESYEALFRVSEVAADEARQQAGLPEVYSWTTMSQHTAHRLAIACRIRLLEAT